MILTIHTGHTKNELKPFFCHQRSKVSVNERRPPLSLRPCSVLNGDCPDPTTTLKYPLKFSIHDNVIQWKHFPRYWPLVRGIHRSPVNSPHKGQWRGALNFLWSAPEKRLSKQSRGWWFGTLSRYLWRHYNVIELFGICFPADWRSYHMLYLVNNTTEVRYLKKMPWTVPLMLFQGYSSMS